MKLKTIKDILYYKTCLSCRYVSGKAERISITIHAALHNGDLGSALQDRKMVFSMIISI